VCTDCEAVLAAREFISTPLVLVLDGAAQPIGSAFELGKSTVATAPQFGADREAILTAWPPATDHLVLLEPFVRIREALDEAQAVAAAERLPRLTPVHVGPSKSTTRVKPPGDVIKLEQRLYYLLQPSLETLIQSDALHFPFEPFPYQYQGVAFLFPRYSAILA